MAIGAICKGFGQIRNLGEGKIKPFSVDFAYTGDVQEYIVPYTGLYKLEVWGAQGGVASGGKGGYSVGYKDFKKGTVLYVVCGGEGVGLETSYVYETTQYYTGGYNGGGQGWNYGHRSDGGVNGWGASGGGATHIALVSGTIAEIGKDTFDTKGLIVAGGGGGCGGTNGWNNDGSDAYAKLGGGNGGGLNGANGGGSAYSRGSGATQTSGHAFGSGMPYRSGGGGGYYGGKGGSAAGAGGGSGWIGGVSEITYKDVTYTPSTTQGGNSGNGKAVISFVTK